MTNPFLASNRHSKTLSSEEAQIIADQLRKPSGEQITRVTQAMSESNKSLILKTYAQLAPQKGESILEVGPGNGDFLESLFAALGPEGRLSILDHSQEIISLLEARYDNEISQSVLDLNCGSMGSLPFKSEQFSGICSTNTVYFWQDPAHCLQEIYRVLQVGGRLTLGMRSKKAVQNMPFVEYGFTLYTPSEIIGLIESQGLEIQLVKRDWEGPVDCLCLTAIKPVS